jgi:hypothetical protein
VIIREDIHIRAPLETVWKTFSCLEDWESWNTVCRTCSIDEGEELARDTCFSFTVRPYSLPIRISPVVTICDPGRKVVWAGSRLGISAEHTWVFEETETGVRLISTEEFHGALLWVSRLLFIPSRLHRLTVQLLQQIKSRAEGCRS